MTDKTENLEWHEALALALQGVAVESGAGLAVRFRCGKPEAYGAYGWKYLPLNVWLKRFTEAPSTCRWRLHVEPELQWIEVSDVDALREMRKHPDDEWESLWSSSDGWKPCPVYWAQIDARYRHRRKVEKP